MSAKNCNCSKCSKKKMNALHALLTKAISRRKIAVVKILMKTGCVNVQAIPYVQRKMLLHWKDLKHNSMIIRCPRRCVQTKYCNCPECFKKRVSASDLIYEYISNHDEPTVCALIKLGLVNVKTFRHTDGKTLLHWNAIYGNHKINQCLLLNNGHFVINETDVSGFTALVYAVKNQKFDVAEQLVDFHANVNIGNDNGKGALQWAVTNADDCKINAMYDFLIFCKRRATQESDEQKRKALQSKIAKMRIAKSYGPNAARLKLVKKLLKAGADVESKEIGMFCSPIQHAAYTGDLELMETLIDAGADINRQNRLRAGTALHGAVFCCEEKMVKLLLSHGANVNVNDFNGLTPIHWATYLNVNKSYEAIINELSNAINKASIKAVPAST